MNEHILNVPFLSSRLFSATRAETKKWLLEKGMAVNGESCGQLAYDLRDCTPLDWKLAYFAKKMGRKILWICLITDMYNDLHLTI